MKSSFTLCLMVGVFAHASVAQLHAQPSGSPGYVVSSLVVDGLETVQRNLTRIHNDVRASTTSVQRAPNLDEYRDAVEQVALLQRKWQDLGRSYPDLKSIVDLNTQLFAGLHTAWRQLLEEADRTAAVIGWKRWTANGSIEALGMVAAISVEATQETNSKITDGKTHIRMTAAERDQLVNRLRVRFPFAASFGDMTVVDLLGRGVLEFLEDPRTLPLDR